MSEEMEDIIARIMAENQQEFNQEESQPVSYEDRVAIEGFRNGHSEGSYNQIWGNIDETKNDDGPVFGPAD